MKPDKAKELIKETFEQSFDKDRFVWFVKNLFPDKIEFRNKVYTGNYIKEAYRAYIRKYEQVGKFEDEEGSTIDLLAVELLRGQSVERARTSQRNFIAQYLKNKNHREGALVAFYSEGSDDWRFSLIKMEYSLEKKKDELTPAKRFSFLVGKDEKSHTAQNQLTGLLTMQTVPTLPEIEAAFNIETVTKEFFEKYKQLFLDLNDHVEKEIKKSKPLREELESRNIDAPAFTKKLLGQIVFLYFLQKKGWLGVPKGGKMSEGNKKYLRTLLIEAISKDKYFFSDYLVFLFYEALATEHNEEGVEYYYKKLKCRIPFLNGGLFEADYNWEKITVDIPNKLFTNRNKTKEGDEGDGILDVFDRYNFTVKEDEPLDKEVAVDPEMLGKVFENLLEVKDRKSKGAFYTPREIVHYMCQESLIAYLDTAINGEATSFQKLGIEQTDMFGNKTRKGQLALEVEHGNGNIKVSRETIETLIRDSNQLKEYVTQAVANEKKIEAGEIKSSVYKLTEHFNEIKKHAAELDGALHNIRICDPAIGSGAFPVGMMNEIVKAREFLTELLPREKISQQSFNHTNQSSDNNRTAYELKRHTIQECIYGVDIDHSAIDIAKLRLWLSLVVDEEDFYKIKPLPNLDYKIVYGNSLIGLPDNVFKNDAAEKELEKLKAEYFSETVLEKKKKLRKQIVNTRDKLIATANEFLHYKVDFDFKLYFSEVYHEKKGFDVVIGNPPYIKVQNLSYEVIDLYKSTWSTAWKRIDISTLFLELGHTLLNKKGHLCFISSNQFITTEYGRLMRKYLLRSHTLKSIIDFGDLPVFDNALTYVSVFLLSKKPSESFNYHRITNLPFDAPTKFSKIELLGLSDDIWSLGDSKQLAIIKKLQEVPERLDKYAKCWAGIFTGKDDLLLFDIDDKVNHIEKDLLIPIVRAQGCFRYGYAEPSKKSFYPYKEGDNKTEIIELDELKKKYPRAFLFINEHKKELKSRMDSRKSFGDKESWYGLTRFGRLSRFKKPKIVSPGEVKQNKFSLDLTGSSFSCARVFSITSEDENLDIKYLLAVLNSKLMEFYLHKNSSLKQGGYYTYSSSVIDAIPLKFNPKNQKPFIILVDKILEAKKQDPKANTSSREKQLDIMVYHLYNLTYEEAKIIDAELSEEDFHRYKL